MPSCTRAPPGIVNEDEGRARLERQLHHVDDLGAVDFSGGAAAHREILAGNMHHTAGYAGAPGDHAIGRQIFLLHAEVGCAMPGESPDFLETVRIDQQLEALASRQFPGCMLLLDALFSTPLQDRTSLRSQFKDVFRRQGR